ncbi:snaclec alboaggregin-A subunit beta'-like [Nerophis ophidion]|uniref:snaclec alboaggregin-A subunit beta'-like n=1 Tax=Nerophis ophidion TaxID=159077 RepID=UPI002ADF7B7B|nr:snaclec alboaggregin-A subunit beta'-like [Nerophis ophidion]
MRFTLFLLCGIGGLVAGTWALPVEKKKKDCCPPGWTQVEGHCYIVQDDPRIFSDAERVCNTLGGNLASITDAVKNAAVAQLVRNNGFRPAWIGLTDAVREQVYAWTDGSPFDFQNLLSSFFLVTVCTSHMVYGTLQVASPGSPLFVAKKRAVIVITNQVHHIFRTPPLNFFNPGAQRYG